MNWKEYISKLNLIDHSTKYELNPPAEDIMLQQLILEFALRELPPELEELYKQGNGICELLDEQEIGDLVWPIEKVIKTNIEYRSFPDFKNLYMSFDQLLFVSEGGNGDLFGFVSLNGKFDRNDIFAWNHEDDSRCWVAPHLTRFIEGRTNGSIKDY